MPQDKSYRRYSGSLTTPDCREGVDWHIYSKPITISQSAFDKFKTLYKEPNNRPIQNIANADKKTAKEDAEALAQVIR